MKGQLHAWGDESIRLAIERPSYLLGAAVADPERCDEYRDVLRSLLRRGPKLHWRNLDDSARLIVASTIADLGLTHVVVVGTPVAERHQERARALCLERLAWELHEIDVVGLTLEARPTALMKRDLRTIDGLRGKRAIPRGLRVEHGLPSGEPMLWIADQVLGALGDSFAGEPQWFESLAACTRIERIAL